jgi:TatD DNase family protein
VTKNWPAFDAHAHIDTDIDADALAALGAIVLAATRDLDEFASVANRRDPTTVWGVGVHPGRSAAVRTFARQRFVELIAHTPFVGEVGLDGRSRVPMERQRDVLDEIFTVLDSEPRLTSVHSANATSEVLEALEQRPIGGVILHWWTGTPAETRRAIELGCYFSVNPTELTERRVLRHVPLRLLLPETDHPFGDRRTARARPGEVNAVERAIAEQSEIPATEIRPLLWSNLAAIVANTGTGGMFPKRVQALLLAAPPHK